MRDIDDLIVRIDDLTRPDAPALDVAGHPLTHLQAHLASAHVLPDARHLAPDEAAALHEREHYGGGVRDHHPESLSWDAVAVRCTITPPRTARQPPARVWVARVTGWWRR